MKTFKTFTRFKESKFLDDRLDKIVHDEIIKRKFARFPINATDDIGMRLPPNKPAFTFPSPNSDMIIQVFLKKMTPSKGQPKGMMAFNWQFEDK